MSNQGRLTRRLPVLAGSALVWILSSGVASASLYQLTVQPIQVCEDDGSGCANAAMQLYELETDKIWAQAGIDVEFLPWTSWWASNLLSVNSTERDDLMVGSGNGANLTPGVISMWFVNDLPGGDYGVASAAGPRTLIADSTFAGSGRLDVIAHELGHNLGLDHYAGSSASVNLMSVGRNVPLSLIDIYPDGAGLDQLTPEQIAQALTVGEANGMLSEMSLSGDALANPEPSTLVLLGGGLAYAVRVIRRRRSTPPTAPASTTPA